MARQLVIGDIHGGLRALVQVLERAAVTAEDSLIFLGDYVDGWSDSAPLIDHLIQLDNRNNCVFIKGNHDTWHQQWLNTGEKNDTWLSHGGKGTIASYENYSDDEKKLHAAFFNRLQYFVTDAEGRLFIHAGYTSLHGPRYQDDPEQCTRDRTLWETALAMDPTLPKDSLKYPRRFNLFTEIYIGHTPTLNFDEYAPMNGANVWNMDTGAAFTGKLSLMDTSTKQVWQSDILPQLYPGEKGRNKK